MTKDSSGRERLIKRLSGYWKMEAANALVVPAAMVFLSSGRIGVASLVAMLPMVGLLIVGAAYWYAKLHQLASSRSPDALLRRIGALETPLLIATMLAVGAAVAAWTIEGVATGLPDRIVASIAAALAALEYVNYYHRQLQHFDHMADWKRLLSGKGFRKSQLRHDLERLGLR